MEQLGLPKDQPVDWTALLLLVIPLLLLQLLLLLLLPLLLPLLLLLLLLLLLITNIMTAGRDSKDSALVALGKRTMEQLGLPNDPPVDWTALKIAVLAIK
jgi:hypothetical protein